MLNLSCHSLVRKHVCRIVPSESTVTGNSKSLKPSEKDAKVPVQSKEAPVKMPGMDIPIFTEDFLEHNKSKSIDPIWLGMCLCDGGSVQLSNKSII